MIRYLVTEPRLDKLLKPGEALQINKRGKAYAIIELVEDADPYEKVLNAIEGLPEPEEELRTVAKNYKANLYGPKLSVPDLTKEG